MSTLWLIRKANSNDTEIIESILKDVVIWMKEKGIDNMWNEENIKWEFLSKTYKIYEFFICFYNKEPAACMAITDSDDKYWSEIPKGESLYVHKLAVKRRYAGMNIATKMIEYSKELAKKRNIEYIRLDFNKKRDKLRELYESNGFKYIKECNVANDYYLDLYACYVE